MGRYYISKINGQLSTFNLFSHWIFNYQLKDSREKYKGIKKEYNTIIRSSLIKLIKQKK